MKAIRKSVIAGSWYPGETSVLKKDIKKYLANVPDSDVQGEIIGLVAPHAGYIYSGQVAAYAYKLIEGKKYDAVIVVGPSHRIAFHGVSIYRQGGYETPLGVVPIAGELAADLMKYSKIIDEIPAAHAQEHSLEIQLPFLQIALGDFAFVPLVMGDQNAETCHDLAQAIYKAANKKKILLVGSSDLSHFHNYNTAQKMDSIVLDHLQNGDAEGLLESLDQDACEACGGGPMVVVMLAAKKMGAVKSKLLKYANSGDVSGDRSSVVGYTASVYYK